MSQLQISGLSFAYPGSPDTVFEHFDLRLDTGWRTGIVARNGRGKTTLLRLLARRLTPQAGSISPPVPTDFFPCDVPDPTLSTLEALENTAPDVESWRLYRELADLEVNEAVLARPFHTLSLGEQTRCLLALLFLREGHFLLIDEPTNHLDMAGRAAVSRYLRRQQGFLLVSHDRAFLDGCVDHIIALEPSGAETVSGSFSTWWTERRRREDFERAQRQKLTKDIARLEAAQKQTARWSDRIEQGKIGSHAFDRGAIGHKAAKMMKRSKAVENRRQTAIEEKQGLLQNVEKTPALELRPLLHPKSRLVELRELSIDYGGGPLFSPLTFTVEQGQRLALTGPNGTGKSSLLKLLAGVSIPHSGTVSAASNLVLSVVPQDASFLSGLPGDYAAACGVDLTRFLSFLRKLDFPRTLFDRDMSTYSAGQKKKVLLARSLSESAHLYLWDEPLNYVDVFSRMQLEALLRDFPAALVLVEHDRAFLDAVAPQRLELAAP